MLRSISILVLLFIVAAAKPRYHREDFDSPSRRSGHHSRHKFWTTDDDKSPSPGVPAKVDGYGWDDKIDDTIKEEPSRAIVTRISPLHEEKYPHHKERSPRYENDEPYTSHKDEYKQPRPQYDAHSMYQETLPDKYKPESSEKDKLQHYNQEISRDDTVKLRYKPEASYEEEKVSIQYEPKLHHEYEIPTLYEPVRSREESHHYEPESSGKLEASVYYEPEPLKKEKAEFRYEPKYLRKVEVSQPDYKFDAYAKERKNKKPAYYESESYRPETFPSKYSREEYKPRTDTFSEKYSPEEYKPSPTTYNEHERGYHSSKMEPSKYETMADSSEESKDFKHEKEIIPSKSELSTTYSHEPHETLTESKYSRDSVPSDTYADPKKSSVKYYEEPVQKYDYEYKIESPRRYRHHRHHHKKPAGYVSTPIDEYAPRSLYSTEPKAHHHRYRSYESDNNVDSPRRHRHRHHREHGHRHRYRSPRHQYGHRHRRHRHHNHRHHNHKDESTKPTGYVELSSPVNPPIAPDSIESTSFTQEIKYPVESKPIEVQPIDEKKPQPEEPLAPKEVIPYQPDNKPSETEEKKST